MNNIKNEKTIEDKINLNLLFISFLVFFIVIVLRYIGPHHNLFFAIEYKLNNHFSNDLHITNSVIVNSGAYYFLFKYFLSNDYLGLLIHIVFSFIAILYLFKILELIKEIETTEIFIILLGFLTLDHFVMPYVRTATAFIGQHHSSSIGLYLNFPCIFYSLKNNLIKYCIFLTLSVLISPKLALFSNLILSIFLIISSPQ